MLGQRYNYGGNKGSCFVTTMASLWKRWPTCITKKPQTLNLDQPTSSCGTGCEELHQWLQTFLWIAFIITCILWIIRKAGYFVRTLIFGSLIWQSGSLYYLRSGNNFKWIIGIFSRKSMWYFLHDGKLEALITKSIGTSVIPLFYSECLKVSLIKKYTQRNCLMGFRQFWVV